MQWYLLFSLPFLEVRVMRGNGIFFYGNVR